ncbi:hypothetical protein HMPREF2880_02540 [Neisseria sp. HMSC067G11]|jgi:hypothetical protein|uniref:hypothetical protein n=1 Tax=unclassified Neisseria TaxID=2623750 RepID=UPI00066C30CB|nr:MULTISPECIES: hypothetical protein [unclassified Neisseria]OFK02367.1 hypothetical protein HMPREF2834_02220 [Neisseria sp. HMSC067H04]OFQ11880.1 hypothetical protein HMPREF2952_01225 [Neisseria sp. HMSC068C12]OFR56008.1 hypothetical protein HMPREF2880_02540 [Neisseria sp. HMSC067G11]OFR70989.1 hypothetical protein HMPREF2871_03575 [Neisseria sp. HMSC067G12]
MATKGMKAEELLRYYFLKSGYFVVRGVPYQYDGFDITDIDLFLYGRTSAFSREKIIVDIKNKKTPQALERIFWTKGLQQALGVDKAIVATTENRLSIVKYGKEQNVVVLNKDFLRRIDKYESEYKNNRLTDEEFYNLINSYSLQRLDGDWKGKIRTAKKLIPLGMSFDHINHWLETARFFAEQSITNIQYAEISLRCLYLICSFISIGIDYKMLDVSFSERSEKLKYLDEGFRYGSYGSAGINKIIQTSIKLVDSIPNGAGIANQIREHLETGFNDDKFGILSDYFSRIDVSKNLFHLARTFEQLAMSKIFVHHSSNIDVKSMLFLLLDFWGISRTKFENTSL